MTEPRKQPPLLGRGLPFEDQPVGMRFRTVGRTVTEADITNFVSVTGMLEVLFTNTEYLREHSLLGARPAPAALVFAFAEGLVIQAALQQVGLAFLGAELDVKAPVLAGDTVHVEVTVSEARLTSKPGRGLVRTENLVVNQRGETVLRYLPLRMIRCRDG